MADDDFDSEPLASITQTYELSSTNNEKDIDIHRLRMPKGIDVNDKIEEPPETVETELQSRHLLHIGTQANSFMKTR